MVIFELFCRKVGKPEKVSGRSSDVGGAMGSTRSANSTSVVVPESRRMVYFVVGCVVVEGVEESVVPSEESVDGETADVSMRLEKGIGTFWTVPLWTSLSNLMFTCVPGGNGLGAGSDLLRRRPHMRPPSNCMFLG